MAAMLASSSRVLIVTHENPDGDGIGSALALWWSLRQQGKDVHCHLTDACPEKYRFLPGAGALSHEPPHARFDCAIALDCDGADRLAGLLPAFSSALHTCSIDHHNGEHQFADANWVDAGRAATALMVHELLLALGAEVTPEVATCLYTAIVADTGVFRFQNTSAEALGIAGRLVACGADPCEIARRTSDAVPLRKAHLTGRALSAARPYASGRLLVSLLALSDFAQTDSRPEDTDGIIDHLKQIDGPEVVVLAREQEPSSWRVSMRSRTTDVSALCRELGGGGHRLAAGCSVSGSATEVVRRLVGHVEAALTGVTPS